MTVEHVYPHAAPWVWQTLFWGGVTFITVSALYLLYLHFPRNHALFAVNGTARRRAKLTTLGIFLSFAGASLAIMGLALTIIGNMQSANVPPGTIVIPEVKEIEKRERTYVPPGVTPERLFSFYRDNTSIQANEITKQYIGQWMKVDGNLNDVNSSNKNFAGVTFQRDDIPLQERTWMYYTTINMYFRERIDRLKGLKPGDKLTVIGEITEIHNVLLSLDNCELVYPASK
jgi:hypothetical protein